MSGITAVFCIKLLVTLVGGFLLGISVTCTYETYRHDATEILLTMVLNTITIAITLLVTT
jgi:hypothetical protein